MLHETFPIRCIWHLILHEFCCCLLEAFPSCQALCNPHEIMTYSFKRLSFTGPAYLSPVSVHEGVRADEDLFTFPYLCLHVCSCLPGYVSCVFTCPQRSEEGVRTPAAGVAGDCKPPDVNAGKRTRSCVRITSVLSLSMSLSPGPGPFKEIILKCGIQSTLFWSLSSLPKQKA